jgi:hypothetical protein
MAILAAFPPFVYRSGMSSSCRKCEYGLPDLNGKFCGKAVLQKSQMNG